MVHYSQHGALQPAQFTAASMKQLIYVHGGQAQQENTKAAATAAAIKFKAQLDTNHDGVVDREEWEGKHGKTEESAKRFSRCQTIRLRPITRRWQPTFSSLLLATN